MKTHPNRIRIITIFALTSTLFVFTLLPNAYGRYAPTKSNVDVANIAPTATQLEGYLNINEASEAQWNLLPGIGPTIAKRLVEYRSQRPFGSISQVRRVKGIGQKKYQKIKQYLSVHGETTLKIVQMPGTFP